MPKPLTHFEIPTDTSKSMRTLRREQLYRYGAPEPKRYLGCALLRAEVFRNDEHRGYVYIPPQYENLWRELVYGAIYWEKAACWLKGKVSSFRRPLKTAVETLRANAEIKHRQFLLCRRTILQELQLLRFDPNDRNQVFTFIEFGIRFYRDLLNDSFNYAYATGQMYLALDPTRAENLPIFSKSMSPSVLVHAHPLSSK